MMKQTNLKLNKDDCLNTQTALKGRDSTKIKKHDRLCSFSSKLPIFIQTKRIGLIGGLSPQSTILYYNWLMQLFNKRVGGIESPVLLLDSLNQGVFANLVLNNHHEEIKQKILASALRLKAAGADFIAISCNSVHSAAEFVETESGLRVINIIDTVANYIKKMNISCVGMLGTRAVTTPGFYSQRLKDKHCIDTLFPTQEAMQILDTLIFTELCNGLTNENNKRALSKIMNELIKRGAECIILGCTELPMLIDTKNYSFPIIDSNYLHANAIIDACMETLPTTLTPDL